MEKFSSQDYGQEKIAKQAVLDSLKQSGPDNPETKALVLAWTMQQEALVTAENTSRAAIIFNIERTDLYLAVGDNAGAFDCLNEALLQAHQEGEPELYDQIMEKIKDLEK
ncbi:MAG: hypothetical protein WCW02_04575 [Candidatus Buchananbacteria bacterium]